MLNYLKAVSFFLIWATIALTSHFFISNLVFNNCEITTISKSIDSKEINESSTPLLYIINQKNDTVFSFSNSFIISAKNSGVPNLKNFQLVTDSIKNYLKNSYETELFIIGYFVTNEQSDSHPENLGLQRANSIKKTLTSSGIHSSKIKTFGKELFSSNNTEEISYERIQIQFNSLNKTQIDSIEYNISNKLLYIEFNEANQFEASENLREYTRALKLFLNKYPDKQILITGHTDNNGYFQNNLIIGLNRANSLKEYFIAVGLESSKMATHSKGESQPIANKYTEEGKVKNKRIEITIK